MTEIKTNSPHFEQAFNVDYWGDLQTFDPSTTCERTKERTTTAGFAIAMSEANDAWTGVLDGVPVVDSVPAGEKFDVFDLELSKRVFYQYPGSVLLVDIERIDYNWREVQPPDNADELFVSSASAFMRAIQAEQLPASGGKEFVPYLELSNPDNPLEVYTRKVLLIIMVANRRGSSTPIMGSRAGFNKAGNLDLKVKPVFDNPGEGLGVIGQSYVEYDPEDNPVSISRLRSVEVCSRGAYSPPELETRKTIGSLFLNGLMPSPGH